MSKDMLVIVRGECDLLRSRRLVSGIRKLGQQFIIELMTIKGSMKYFPERGTSFLPRLKQARTEADVLIALAVANKELKRNLRIGTTSRTPKDERYKDASVESIELVDTSVVIGFVVRSVAGTTIRVTAPPIMLG